MIGNLFFYVILPIIAIYPFINGYQISKLDSKAEKEEKICKCGSKMVKSRHSQYVYTRSAKCMSCNRTVQYAVDYQLYTPIKSWKQELWTQPKDFLVCKKCGSDFFNHKFLDGSQVMFLKCSKCGEEMDLRK